MAAIQRGCLRAGQQAGPHSLGNFSAPPPMRRRARRAERLTPRLLLYHDSPFRFCDSGTTDDVRGQPAWGRSWINIWLLKPHGFFKDRQARLSPRRGACPNRRRIDLSKPPHRPLVSTAKMGGDHRMFMTNSNDKSGELLGQERGRRWSPKQKLAMVRESLEPGQGVSVVARRNGILHQRSLQLACQMFRAEMWAYRVPHQLHE
ncbi:transposase [Pseudomonas veronii]